MQHLQIAATDEEHEDIPYSREPCDAPSFRLFNDDDPEFMSTQEMVEAISSAPVNTTLVALRSPSPAQLASSDVTNSPPPTAATSLATSRAPSPSPAPPLVPSRSPSPAVLSPLAARSPSPAELSLVAARSPSPALATPAASRSPSPAAPSPASARSPSPVALQVGDSSGPSTHELKNKKKRAHKEVDDDDVAEAKKM